MAYNFRRLRRQKKWTQKETAEKGEVGRTYITRIERANVGLGPSGQRKWAVIFGVDISEFFKPAPGEEEEIRPGAAGKGKTKPKKRDLALDLMREIIETVEEIFQKKRLHLPPRKKADLIMIVYDEISENRARRGRKTCQADTSLRILNHVRSRQNHQFKNRRKPRGRGKSERDKIRD